MTLQEVVNSLASMSDEFAIYVVEPWSRTSKALVPMETSDGRAPPEAVSKQAKYFLEVSLARQFLEDWCAAMDAPSIEEQCDRLIQYAVNDA